MKFFWDIVYAKTKLVFNVSLTVSAFINRGCFYFYFYTVDHPSRLPGMSFCAWYEFLFWRFNVMYGSNSFQPKGKGKIHPRTGHEGLEG